MAAKPAPEPDLPFHLQHPALVATVVTIALIAGFLGALYQSAQGHHGPSHGAAPHGSASGAKPAASAPAASAAKPAGSTAPAAK